MRVIVVAAAEKTTLATGNRLPWRLPEDLKRFKALTLGKPIVMGRKTFDVDRQAIARAHEHRDVTAAGTSSCPAAIVVDSLEAAVAAAAGDARELVRDRWRASSTHRRYIPRT